MRPRYRPGATSRTSAPTAAHTRAVPPSSRMIDGPPSGPAGLQGEVELELRPARLAAVHASQVQAGGDLPDLVADVGPHPRRLAVVHDDRRPAVEPARPVTDAGLDRPEAQPLVDERAVAGV